MNEKATGTAKHQKIAYSERRSLQDEIRKQRATFFDIRQSERICFVKILYIKNTLYITFEIFFYIKTNLEQ
jgi:hypothetical protein